MILLEKRLTEKVKHRKQIIIQVIIHDSTIEKITDNSLREFVYGLVKFQINSDEKEVGYSTTRKVWEDIFKVIPKVKIDNRFKLGVYTIVDKLYLKVRNPNRFKTQVTELIHI